MLSGNATAPMHAPFSGAAACCAAQEKTTRAHGARRLPHVRGGRRSVARPSWPSRRAVASPYTPQETTLPETNAPAPVNPAEAFASLILLSHRWTALVGALPVMTAHSLSVPGFVLPAATGAEPGTAVGKLARKAGVAKGDIAATLRDLRDRGPG